MSELTKVELNTAGLHCRSCSALVDMTVGDIDGVSKVTTDHETGVTKVEFDSALATLDGIIGALRSAGYDAEKI